MKRAPTPPLPRRLYPAYIFDLDGTTYLGGEALPTAVETIRTLREAGSRTVFLSNNPTHTRRAYAARLNRLGIAAVEADIVHSSLVMVDFLQERMPGARLFVAGEEALRSELLEAGFHLSTDPNEIQAVIASFDRTFDYARLQTAFDAIRSGARFFATNADRYCPVPGGGQPDAAAVIAAIEACTDTRVEAVVGKPSPYMAAAILRVLQTPAHDCLMVGDRLETDIAMGIKSGMDTALVLTGATSREEAEAADLRPGFILEELGELLGDLISRQGEG